ncbi:MAG: LysM peptidoglycan-binding domain-containing protein [Parvularculaceae bacterium]|nr:LysM peptidoglycan-binding domain-containing protein [Parvularculaceae bacterium]
MARALLLSAAAAALSACATSVETAGRDPYASVTYTGAEQFYAADLRAAQYPPAQSSENGTPFELVSYEGINGARRAHQLYTRAEAEALDGRCEKFIEPSATETLADIADLCDVPLETLVAYNPDVKSVNYAERVVTIEIPGGKVNPSGTFAASDALASLYEVKEGDSLSAIAYRLNVSADALANLNPDVTWTTLTPGQLLQRPVAASAAPVATYVAPTPGWEGYAGNRGGPSDARRGADVRHAPYALRPTRPFAGRDPGTPVSADLVVDKPAVRAGDRVRVTARRLSPGEEVTFYSGEALDRETDAAGDRMKEVGRARADENGEASASIRVKRKSDMGGVIFKAVPERSNGALYSDRVGVVNVDGKGDADEQADDAAEE